MDARHGEGSPETRADGGLVNWRRGRGGRNVTFRESRRAHAGGERQPGKRLELVVDVEGFEVGGRALGIDEGRGAAAIVENGAKKLAIALVEAEEANLEVVSLVVGG